MAYSSIEELQSLIDNKIEESTTLEYKSSFAKNNAKWKEELAKDVSAMANSNGGIIIYGIREKDGKNGHSIPEELLPISNSEMSKDQLSQLLTSHIQPIIEDLEITYIPYDEHSGCYVVNVPKCITAHQNRLTHIYYMRRNSTVEAMEDYQIRDVMNRSKHPIIDIEFSLIETIFDVRESGMTLLGKQSECKYYQETEYVLSYMPINNGNVYAKYINYFIYIPKVLIDNSDNFYQEDGKYVIVSGENTVRDLMSIDACKREYGPARYVPILPGVCGSKKEIILKSYDSTSAYPPLKYEIHADNSPTRIETVNWSDVKPLIFTKNIVRDSLNKNIIATF